MIQVGNVPDINDIKTCLGELVKQDLIESYEVPYETILTRLTAAIFFFTPVQGAKIDHIWNELTRFPGFKYEKNKNSSLSEMPWKIEFNEGLT